MRRKLVFFALLAPLVVAALAVVAAPPTFARQSFAPRQIGPDMRCPVCRMFPARYPKWHAEIIFTDNRMAAFESPADLFRFLHQMGKYDQHHTAADVAAVYVTDYLKGGWHDARHAYFVAGSRVKGPMGDDLPAFSRRSEASRFAAASGGKVVVFDQVTPALIRGLRGSMSGKGMNMKHMDMSPPAKSMGRDEMHQ